MSPEQVEDARKADVRSDVYSLGCTLYFLMRSKAPYSGDTVAHTLMAHISAPIPDLCKKRTDVPDWLGAVFQKMLAKKARDRFQTMAELVETIQQHLGEGLTKHDSSDDSPLEAEDAFTKLIAKRSDAGDSLEELFSEDKAAAAGDEEFVDPDAPAGAHLVDVGDESDENSTAPAFGKRDDPAELNGEEVDFTAIAGTDGADEPNEIQQIGPDRAEMASVQVFDLNARAEENPAKESVNEAEPANSTAETFQSEHHDGGSKAENTAFDGSYFKSKLAIRELREKEAARELKIIGTVAGITITLGVAAYLIFGRG
jgi:hypothetical protein